jgi:hypothetical protein
MQTLGLSDSTPRTDGRLKSLFWPSIKTSNDVDYLGSQGLWVCSAIGVLSFVVMTLTGNLILGFFVLVLYYLSGVGVREGSRYAAGWAFVTYFGDMLVTGPHIVKILLSALLLSNFRATWIASRWKPDAPESTPPPRWNDTWTDKFADIWPTALWPRLRILYYILSVAYLGLLVMGIRVILMRRHIL